MTTVNVFPKWIWMVYLILFCLTVPWYFDSETAITLVLGLPLWLVVSILMILLMALFTVWVIHRFWKE